MRVEKYKKEKDGKYKVTFDNKKEMSLYEDTILKYELLLKRDISNIILEELIKFNQELDVYYSALKILKVKARSVKEISDLLKKKEYPVEYIDSSIKKLSLQGYLNDLSYAKSFLNTQIITTSRGPYKIRFELEKRGISRDIIAEVMELYDENIEKEKIKKHVNRMILSNRNKGNSLLKRKIMMELINQGFNKNIIEEIVNNSKFGNDDDLYKKEYAKIHEKLSSKYSGNELKYKIRQKLYQKGFSYDE